MPLASSWGSGYFQVNELYTRKLEALPSAYTQHKQSYISLIKSKITMFQSNIFSSGCIDKYILIPGRYLLFISKIYLKALIITIADDMFCNNFLHFGYKKID